MRNKLLQLFARNRAKGEFRAEANVIYVYDVIVASDAEAEFWGGVSAETFVKTLKGMSGDVDLRINSPGGDVFGAKAMAQAIRDHGGKVTAHVDGYAASAATFLTAVAGEVVMSPGSMLMIHDAWTFAMGNAEDLTATAALLSKIDGTIADAYAAAAQRRGVEGQDFAQLMDDETWFTGDEAIAAGLADRIAEDAPKAKADWDLSVYDHAPQPEGAGKLQLRLSVDQDKLQAAVAAAIIVEPVTASTDEEPAPPAPDPAAEPPADPDEEIEALTRPNFVRDMLLRPAA